MVAEYYFHLLFLFSVSLFVGFIFGDFKFLFIGLVFQFMYFGFGNGDLIGEFYKLLDALPLMLLFLGEIYLVFGSVLYLAYRRDKGQLESIKGSLRGLNYLIFSLVFYILYLGYSKDDFKGEILKFLNVLPMFFLFCIVATVIFALIVWLAWKSQNSDKKQ